MILLNEYFFIHYKQYMRNQIWKRLPECINFLSFSKNMWRKIRKDSTEWKIFLQIFGKCGKNFQKNAATKRIVLPKVWIYVAEAKKEKKESTFLKIYIFLHILKYLAKTIKQYKRLY